MSKCDNCGKKLPFERETDLQIAYCSEECMNNILRFGVNNQRKQR